MGVCGLEVCATGNADPPTVVKTLPSPNFVLLNHKGYISHYKFSFRFIHHPTPAEHLVFWKMPLLCGQWRIYTIKFWTHNTSLLVRFSSFSCSFLENWPKKTLELPVYYLVKSLLFFLWKDFSTRKIGV